MKDYEVQKALQDYRAGERNAEAIAAGYYARKALQEYHQGEREEYIEQPKSLWQQMGEWVQQKIVQPVQQAWHGVTSFVQDKIIQPAQQTWKGVTSFVQDKVIQPVTHWWKKDVPVWAKETVLSLIPIVGDGWGLIRQGINWFEKKPVDKLDVVLSLAGLVFDIPWPQEGLIGGDVTVAVLKGMSAVIPPGPARDVMTQLVKDGLKNPDDLARIVKTSEVLLANERVLKALIDNPQALEAVMRFGPGAVEILSRYGDEAIELVGKHGDDGLNFLSKNTLTPSEISELANLPKEATQLADDVASKIGVDYKNSPLRIEYENKVTGLQEELQEILQRNNGIVTEADAKALFEARRNLGIEYKDITPGPLQDYIYELNSARYAGDPLGPDWDFLMEKYDGDYLAIANAATRPNKNINDLLSGFNDWLRQKGVEYLLDAELRSHLTQF